MEVRDITATAGLRVDHIWCQLGGGADAGKGCDASTLACRSNRGVRFYRSRRIVQRGNARLILAWRPHRQIALPIDSCIRVGGCIDTHVTSLSAAADSLTITRWFYRQRMEGSLARTRRPWILLLDPGARVAWQGNAGAAPVECISVTVPDTLRRTTVQGMATPPADQQTIRPDAKLLFVAGAGWTKKQKDGQAHVAQAETLIRDFLKNSKASLGGSKSLVELSGENQAALGFMSHLNQVG
jgi:electron transfer flavoprotein alpha subunit